MTTPSSPNPFTSTSLSLTLSSSSSSGTSCISTSESSLILICCSSTLRYSLLQSFSPSRISLSLIIASLGARGFLAHSRLSDLSENSLMSILLRLVLLICKSSIEHCDPLESNRVFGGIGCMVAEIEVGDKVSSASIVLHDSAIEGTIEEECGEIDKKLTSRLEPQSFASPDSGVAAQSSSKLNAISLPMQ